METSILDLQHISNILSIQSQMFIAACFQRSEYNLSCFSPGILVQSSHYSLITVNVGTRQQETLLIEDIAGLPHQ